MDKAKYTQTTVNGASNGLYPLSTQALDLIQQQIEMLQNLSKIGGKNYILKEPTADIPGVVVIDGEMLPLSGTRQLAIRVYEEVENITADGDVYVGARVRRWAQYQSTYSKFVPNLYLAGDFQVLPTNLDLNLRFSNYTDLANKFATKLTVLSYNNLKRSDIDALHTENIRVHCRKGCVVLNGAEEYTINVYRNSDETITQEQLLPNMTRFVRQWDAEAQVWGDFYTPVVKENLHLEVKVTAANRVYVRHGEIPAGVQLVLLRKKKRSGTRRSGGQYTTNKKFIGVVKRRQSKNQYCHYKGIVLSLGTPNKWYVPKVISVGKGGEWTNLIGKELKTVCAEFIQESQGVFRVRNTRFKASDRANVDGTKSSLYVKMGLQLAVANNRSKSPGGEMVQMLYRIWWDHVRDKETGIRGSRRRWGFSVV